MIAVLCGLGAALTWGISTITATRATRAIGAFSVVAWVMTVGVIYAGTLAVIFEGAPKTDAAGWAWAVLGGITAVAGLVVLYAALGMGSVSIVAPIGSTEGAFAALFAVALLGESLSPLPAAALVLIAIGVFIVTFGGAHLSDISRRPALYALCAAVIFGVSLAATAQAGHDIGPIWAVMVARIVGLVGLTLPLLIRGRLADPRPVWPYVGFSGLAEVTGFVLYVIGARHSIAVCAMLGAQYAAVATIISVTLLGERLSHRQIVGVVLIIAGVAVVAGFYG